MAVAISASMPDGDPIENSTVTCAPSRRQTLPSSRPIAGANHHEMVGHFVQLQCTGGANDPLFVDVDASERGGFAAGVTMDFVS